MSSLSVTSEPQQYIVSKEAGVSGVTLTLPVAVLTTAEAAFSTLGLNSLLSHFVGTEPYRFCLLFLSHCDLQLTIR